MKKKTIICPIKYRHGYLKVKPLTTIIVGIKCLDGVVVASDSQSEFGRGVDVKRLNANKITTFDSRYIFAGAGILAHIRTLVENVTFYIQNQEAQQRSQLNKDEAEKVAEQALWALVKHYHVDRSNVLGVTDREYFTPITIFAGRHIAENSVNYYMYFLHGADGTVEPVDDYGAAGSGAAYAELLLKSLYSENIMVDEGIKVGIYIIEEVKSIDPHCGGDTQVAVLKTISQSEPQVSLRILNKTEIDTILREVKPKLDLVRTELVTKILKGDLDENKIRGITGSS